MGSHFSPAACHAAVSLYEHLYFSQCLLNSVRLPTACLLRLDHPNLSRRRPRLPCHIPSTALVAKSHPKIKDVLFSCRQVLQQWDPHVDPTTAGIVCRCSEILRRHPQLTVVEGHVASSATLLHLPEFLGQVAQSSCGNTVFMSAKDHWKTFHAAALRLFLVRQNVQMLWCLARPANSAYSFSDVDGRLWTVC